jgi:hypothetical protein
MKLSVVKVLAVAVLFGIFLVGCDELKPTARTNTVNMTSTQLTQTTWRVTVSFEVEATNRDDAIFKTADAMTRFAETESNTKLPNTPEMPIRPK